MTLEKGRGRYSKYAPYAFTEQGVAMPSAVLKSKRAVQTSITIVRVFIKLRELLTTNKELAHKTGELQRTQKEHAAHITTIYQMVEQIMAPSEVPPSDELASIPTRSKFPSPLRELTNSIGPNMAARFAGAVLSPT